jgi:hypothetical protein
VKGGVVFVAFQAGMIETREQGRQYRRRVSGGFQLPQRDPDAGAAVTVVVASGGIGVGIGEYSPSIFSRENIVWFCQDTPPGPALPVRTSRRPSPGRCGRAADRR